MDESKSMVHDGISKTGFENEIPHTVRQELQAKQEMKRKIEMTRRIEMTRIT